eukprot:SAG25_NODE_15_length_24441_cov_175.207288_25_plen_157_part_00
MSESLQQASACAMRHGWIVLLVSGYALVNTPHPPLSACDATPPVPPVTPTHVLLCHCCVTHARARLVPACTHTHSVHRLWRARTYTVCRRLLPVCPPRPRAPARPLALQEVAQDEREQCEHHCVPAYPQMSRHLSWNSGPRTGAREIMRLIIIITH